MLDSQVTQIDLIDTDDIKKEPCIQTVNVSPDPKQAKKKVVEPEKLITESDITKETQVVNYSYPVPEVRQSRGQLQQVIPQTNSMESEHEDVDAETPVKIDSPRISNYTIEMGGKSSR